MISGFDFSQGFSRILNILTFKFFSDEITTHLLPHFIYSRFLFFISNKSLQSKSQCGRRNFIHTSWRQSIPHSSYLIQGLLWNTGTNTDHGICKFSKLWGQSNTVHNASNSRNGLGDHLPLPFSTINMHRWNDAGNSKMAI